jgi:hypothetical protein
MKEKEKAEKYACTYHDRNEISDFPLAVEIISRKEEKR